MKMRQIELAAVALILLFSGCSVRPAVPSPPPNSLPATIPAISPLEWLREKPFQQVREEASIILDRPPSGFVAAQSQSQEMSLPSGAEARVTAIRYDYMENDQAVPGRHVIITLVSYENSEDRKEHLDLLAGEDYEWFYCDIAGKQVACYRDPDVQGRVWYSEGYLVVLVGGPGQDNSEALDGFAALYLEVLPPD